MGLLLTLNQPSSGMRNEAKLAGKYVWSWSNAAYQRLQIATIEDFLSHRKPEMPMTMPPYSRAQRVEIGARQLSFLWVYVLDQAAVLLPGLLPLRRPDLDGGGRASVPGQGGAPARLGRGRAGHRPTPDDGGRRSRPTPPQP
ncbi:MAG: hypothetical protein QOJ59_1835 [Thermomicrobiales bacterium]|jgi:hypothetical protein|nr:hypothetical protein [Thermomicrobiales bacterium]